MCAKIVNLLNKSFGRLGSNGKMWYEGAMFNSPQLLIDGIYHYNKVPLHDAKKYVSFYEFPFDVEKCGQESEYLNNKKVAVIVQGPIILEDDFTYNTLRLYSKTMKGATIILSTWDDSPREIVKEIESLGVVISVSHKPDNQGRGNVNYQIKSTLKGLNAAIERGCQYAVKTRSDQRLYNNNIIELLFNLQDLFPVDSSGYELEERLIACSFDSFKYRMYGISDMFMFGNIHDMYSYWNFEEDFFDPHDLDGKTDEKIFAEYCSETIIAKSFLRRIGYNVLNTLEDSYNVYRKMFCFVDKEMLGLYWPKYTNQYSRWQWYDKDNILEEISFSEWLRIFNNSSGVIDYTSKELKWRRPIESPLEYERSELEPKVSVLLPVYNTRVEYLRECIDSILDQTYSNFELIIVNDGSTDLEVEKTILKYTDSRIRYYSYSENSGISVVRNRLLKLARGEYIAIMDHDDICRKDRFEKQVAFLDTHKKYGVVGSWHGFVGSDDVFERFIDNFDIKRNLLWDCTLHHPTTMMRKSVIVDNGIQYNEQFSPCEDYSLWCDLLGKTKFYNIPEVLFTYRNNYKNTTNSDWGMIEKRIQEIWSKYRQEYRCRYFYYRVLRWVAKRIKIKHFRKIWLIIKEKMYV